MNILLWSERLGIVALILIGIGVIVVRMGNLKIGLPIFGLGNLLAIAVVVGLLIVLIFSSNNLTRTATIILILCIPPTVLTIKLLSTRHLYPRIHDVTTDIKNPPVFVQALTQRSGSDNPLDIKADSIKLQQQSYADLKSVTSSITPSQAHSLARQVVAKLGWHEYHSDVSRGVIEAYDRTWMLGFTDDIVIRIQSTQTGSVLDLRSVSRRGIGDIGANAKRIRTFLELYKDSESAQ